MDLSGNHDFILKPCYESAEDTLRGGGYNKKEDL
jgi:hypothetical protein